MAAVDKVDESNRCWLMLVLPYRMSDNVGGNAVGRFCSFDPFRSVSGRSTPGPRDALLSFPTLIASQTQRLLR
ncbi:hypothetical protein ZHAS_00019408 [Anopheles sinensis]|uniref:Uncharacterized protein n=1 Tax=Anopheles sinensis TaxID=74873 RepID=A0A084WMA4_ANOSI|nr:hypothetical protein ZHAS_00019408 [Anopheles sinensis]